MARDLLYRHISLKGGKFMTIANSMTDVTIPESLGVSLLGLCVVFLVLVFLMVIIYIMSAIYKKASAKPTTAGETSAAPAPSADVPPPTQAVAATAAITQAPAEAASAEQVTAAPAAPVAAQKPSAPKKYRVIVNGKEYEVDAETGDTAPVLTASEPEAPAVSVDTAPEVQSPPVARSPAQASKLEFSGIKKFKVVVDGKEYEVDAEMVDTAKKSETGRAQ